MELNFQKAGHDYYEPLRFTPFTCETMRENIVPDSCGDIARIVDTTGVVCLTNRELTGDGRFCASGSVEVSVLYIPERTDAAAQGDGPCALRFQIPFQCYGEGQGDVACEFLDIRGELSSIDTRVLNPRKVLTRANLVLYPMGCRHVSMSVCTGVEEGEGIQLLRERRQTRVAAGVREKEFTFTEELPLSPGRGGAEEILSARVDIRGTDSKLIGSKLVVKGLISASVLYKEAGGRLNLLQQDLPFSQILEGNGFDEDCESEAAYRLLSLDCRVGSESAPDDACVMTLSVSLCARVTVWKRLGVAGGGDQLHRRPLQHRRPGGLPDGGAGAQRGLPAHGPPAERQGAPGDRRGGEGGGGHGDRLRRRTAGGRGAEAPGVGPVSVPG